LWRTGASTVAAVALSHPERDHYGGLTAVLRKVPVAEFWSNGRDSSSAGFRVLLDTLGERGSVRRDLAAADVALAAGPDGAIGVLHPPRAARDGGANDTSLVLLLRYGATRVLLTGDIEAPAEASLLRRGEDVTATIVKVPHHGSRTSSTRPLLAASRPGVAVAMLGANNRFGFPATEVRDRYLGLGAAWRESDRDGAIAVVSDGQLERVTTCRASAEP
jgi:competence protein ComEC